MNHRIGIFSIAESCADELLWNRRPWATLDHFRGLPIGPMELADLAALLGIGNYERLIGGFSLLAGESQDMPWVISLPLDLVEAVSSLNDHDIAAAARLWALRGDMTSRFTNTDLEQYLKGAGLFLSSCPGPHVLLVTAPETRDTNGWTSDADSAPHQ